MEDGVQKLYHFFFGGSSFRALYYLEVWFVYGQCIDSVMCLSVRRCVSHC